MAAASAPAPARRGAARSAGILLYQGTGNALKVLLVHPGGPFWARRDEGAWSIPKGEYGPGEDPLAAARREFAEELGSAPPAGDVLDLGEVRQRSGKLVKAYGLAGDLDAGTIVSNTCMVQWPPRSGKTIEIPEVDRAEWFGLAVARGKVIEAQIPLLQRLAERLSGGAMSDPNFHRTR